ncbi:ankyrin repeat-containing protein [Fusarium tjaetaba]|uniref:Ankyrin repeat-containing protein n=1 Tax=Fusarium tjaetaba TaxID=1567544 RepID=A0A8H5R1Z2_9HYPO|nr:ankyrin repeat-containing protein [Fusarium tjaetaba]KAF5624652.1 ankyrin repeat-containing protein [Fusarium tjaetaba]
MELLERLLRNMDSLAVDGLDRDHRMMRDGMEGMQGTVDFMMKGKGGWTPLCSAAEAGCELVAKLLLDTGKVDPNAQDDLNETPLSKAARRGNEGIVKLLLNTDQIDPDARGGDFKPTPLMEAAKKGHETIVTLLVNTGKVDVDAMVKVRYGHEAIVEFLVGVSHVHLDFKYGSYRSKLCAEAEQDPFLSVLPPFLLSAESSRLRMDRRLCGLRRTAASLGAPGFGLDTAT